MGYGYPRILTATMAAAGTTAVFDCGGAFAKVYLQVPSFSSSTALDVKGAVSGTTFYQIRRETGNTATAGATFIVAATAMANGGIVPLPAGFPYYQIVATDSAPAAALTFKIICCDS